MFSFVDNLRTFLTVSMSILMSVRPSSSSNLKLPKATSFLLVYIDMSLMFVVDSGFTQMDHTCVGPSSDIRSYSTLCCSCFSNLVTCQYVHVRTQDIQTVWRFFLVLFSSLEDIECCVKLLSTPKLLLFPFIWEEAAWVLSWPWLWPKYGT